MDPQAVTGQEVGYLTDGERGLAALDVDINLGPREIERRTIGMKDRGKTEKTHQQRQTSTHSSILRGLAKRRQRGQALKPSHFGGI